MVTTPPCHGGGLGSIPGWSAITLQKGRVTAKTLPSKGSNPGWIPGPRKRLNLARSRFVQRQEDPCLQIKQREIMRDYLDYIMLGLFILVSLLSFTTYRNSVREIIKTKHAIEYAACHDIQDESDMQLCTQTTRLLYRR